MELKNNCVKGIIFITLLLFLSGTLTLFGNTHTLADKKKIEAKFNLAEAQFLQGDKFFLNKDYKKAQKKFTKCLEIFPRHSSAYFLLAQLHYNKKDFKQALLYITKAKEHLPFILGIINRGKRKKLAKLEERQKELEAKTVIMKRSCGGTKMQMILKRRIQELEMEIDEEEAILKETSLSKNYILSDYCFFQGNILLRLKRPGDARLLYLQTIDLNPLHKNAYSNLTNIYFLSKQYQQAFDCLNRAEQNDIAIKPGLKAAVLKAVGQGDTGSSMKEFPVGAKGIGIMKFVVSVNLGGSENKSLSENTYVVFNKDTSTALIIDPGAVDKRIENFIQERKLKVKKIMNTHGHYDHSNANRYYADLFKVKIVAHKKDKPLYTKENSKNLPDEFFPFDEGECDYLCEGFTIKIVSTPGHSPGSVCLLIGTNLLAGDTLFKNAIGKTWGKTIGEKIEKTNLIIAGIRAKLFKLPGKTRVFPGHGYASSIENEMASNDFLNKESALAILKDTFESLDSIHEILPMEKNSKDYDAKIVFFKKEGSNTFRGKYGETIYGLKLLLTSASKPVEK